MQCDIVIQTGTTGECATLHLTILPPPCAWLPLLFFATRNMLASSTLGEQGRNKRIEAVEKCATFSNQANHLSPTPIPQTGQHFCFFPARAFCSFVRLFVCPSVRPTFSPRFGGAFFLVLVSLARRASNRRDANGYKSDRPYLFLFHSKSPNLHMHPPKKRLLQQPCEHASPIFFQPHRYSQFP